MTPHEALKTYFGYSQFRLEQEKIIKAVLSGKDCFVLMPTGGGKSICYQIPALISSGISIVISPLISLMKDQVEALHEAGIAAAAFNSNQSAETNFNIQQEALHHRLKILYMSPEMLLSGIHTWIKDLNISLIAVDEAHCISQWGHDFRPEYTRLGIVRRELPHVPLMALTATADKLTRDDILQKLQLHHPFVSISSFDRPNLDLTVLRGFNSSEKYKAIKRFITDRPKQSGIIYCMARKTTEKVALQLQKWGLKALAYHASLSPSLRDEVQTNFINDNIQIVVATIAFGMGIDKSNVRWVIHYNLPKSIESYYQEIGRGGRDGDPADTLLFYNYSDIIQLENFARKSGQSEINMERLSRMKEYAEAGVCRRKILLNYFGQVTDKDCGHCDVCRNPPQKFDGSVEAQKALSAIVRSGQKATFNTVIDILRGQYSSSVCENGFEHLKTFGVGRDLSSLKWRDYLLQMLQMGLFEVAYNHQNTLKITSLGNDVLYGKRNIELAMVEEPIYKPKKTSKKRIKQNDFFKPRRALNALSDEEMFDKLKQLRLQLAREQGLPPYIIFHDKTLHEMSVVRPQTLEELENISGVSSYKKDKYGMELLKILKE